MQDTEKYDISNLEVDIIFHHEKVKAAKAYLEKLPEKFQEYKKVVHKTHKIMTSHFDSLNKAKEFILKTEVLDQIVLDQIKKLKETEKPHNVFYCLYNENLCNENESCFIFWLLSVFEYFIYILKQSASNRKTFSVSQNKENTLLAELNVDFFTPDLILLIILRACKKPNKNKFKEIIDVWYEREYNAIKNKIITAQNRVSIGSGIKVPTTGDVSLENQMKPYLEELDKNRNNLINIASKYTDLLQNIKLLDEFINSYTDNFRNDKLRFEHFNYAKHLFVFNEFLKIKEREGISNGYLTLTPFSFTEIIELVFNPTHLIKESERIEYEMPKYQFIVFLLMIGRMGAIKFLDLDIHCPKDNDSTNDYWAFKISIDPDFRKICGIDIGENMIVNVANIETRTNELIPVLRYDDDNKKILIDENLYELDNKPVLYDILKTFIRTPNVKLSMELFKSNDDTDNPDTIRQRIRRLKKTIPELGKYIPDASKHDSGYILCLEKNQIAKF